MVTCEPLGIHRLDISMTLPIILKKHVSTVEAETGKIDDAIDVQIQQIEKLKEYKTTLINSAVTGKIKVI